MLGWRWAFWILVAALCAPNALASHTDEAEEYGECPNGPDCIRERREDTTCTEHPSGSNSTQLQAFWYQGAWIYLILTGYEGCYELYEDGIDRDDGIVLRSGIGTPQTDPLVRAEGAWVTGEDPPGNETHFRAMVILRSVGAVGIDWENGSYDGEAYCTVNGFPICLVGPPPPPTHQPWGRMAHCDSAAPLVDAEPYWCIAQNFRAALPQELESYRAWAEGAASPLNPS